MARRRMSDGEPTPAADRRSSVRERRGAAARAARTPLTVEAIVERAVAILDSDGTDALTFRRLARELEVGVASLYWHVEDKDDLLVLCFETALRSSMRMDRPEPTADTWQEELRGWCLEMYDAVVAHPWTAATMGDTAVTRTTLAVEMWDRIAATLGAAGCTDQQVFYASSTILAHVAFTAQQAQRIAYADDAAMGREALLERSSERMAGLDEAAYPWVRRLAPILAAHEERDQFLGGLEIIIAGVQAQNG